VLPQSDWPPAPDVDPNNGRARTALRGSTAAILRPSKKYTGAMTAADKTPPNRPKRKTHQAGPSVGMRQTRQAEVKLPDGFAAA
jgi:hypothetical protein